MIECRQLCKQFDGTTILDHIDWQLEPGHIYGLIGPNGAGKSTLLRTIADVLRADRGSVLFNGVVIRDQPEIKQHIFLLSDDPWFFNQATLEKMRLFYKTFYPAFSDERFTELLIQFQLRKDQPLQDFSKGMKRQAALILALSAQPDVLLMDESFDGLDAVMRRQVRGLLADLVYTRQACVVISSHNLRELQDICDQVTILDQKRIILNTALDAMNDAYQKIQLGFRESKRPDDFRILNPLRIDGEGKIWTVLLKCGHTQAMEQVEALHPALINELTLSLEEIFIYEMEERGYGKTF